MMPPPSVSSASLDAALQQMPAGADAGAVRIGLLRELRAEIQDLQVVLHAVRTGKTSIKAFGEYVTKTKVDIAELMAKIVTAELAVRAAPTPNRKSAPAAGDTDNLRHLVNLWEQMQICPLLLDPAGDYDAQAQLNYLDTLDDQIRKMVFVIGSETIPSRLNDWLQKAQPGYYVPFHLVFEDEIPVAADRLRLLNSLSWSPRVIQGGVVDAANGLIYRYESNATRLWVTNALLVVIVVGASVGVRLSGLLDFPGTAFVPAQMNNLGLWWGFVLIGVFVHTLVGNQKRAKAAGGLPPIYALSDVGLIVNARLGQILMKLALALTGFFGFVAATPVDKITPFACLLVGYSLDSIIELFGASLDSQAAAQVETLKSQLKVT